MNFIERKYACDDLEIEIIAYLDNEQNIWFKGKQIANILGYTDTDQAVRKYFYSEEQKSFPVKCWTRLGTNFLLMKVGYSLLLLVQD